MRVWLSLPVMWGAFAGLTAGEKHHALTYFKPCTNYWMGTDFEGGGRCAVGLRSSLRKAVEEMVHHSSQAILMVSIFSVSLSVSEGNLFCLSKRVATRSKH